MNDFGTEKLIMRHGIMVVASGAAGG